jgi:hypothetical protein
MVPGLFSSEPIPPDVPPSPAIARAALPQNRAILDQVFAGSISGDPRANPWYFPAKLGYSFGYSLVMWLLVFGTLGFFQDWCPGRSPAWRLNGQAYPFAAWPLNRTRRFSNGRESEPGSARPSPAELEPTQQS